MIYDRYGRPVLNLRIALTRRCNLSCPYCHREGELPSEAIEMTPEEVCRIVRIASNFGVSKVKLTGGEPLLRQDIVEIVRSISRIPGIDEVSMVTNATLLKEKALKLKEAGLKRINVNLPTLNSELYRELIGGDIKDVIQGIEAATLAGINPIKVNMLILRNVNDGEVYDMMRFCAEKGLILQLIELEPTNLPSGYYEEYHVSLEEIERELMKKAMKVEVREFMHSRKVIHLPNVKVEIVHPIENSEFCLHCTRMRVTSDGKLKPCLMRNDNLIDILTPMRRGASDETLAKIFLEAVNRREPYYKGN